jgi:hypothetical protein
MVRLGQPRPQKRGSAKLGDRVKRATRPSATGRSCSDTACSSGCSKMLQMAEATMPGGAAWHERLGIAPEVDPAGSLCQLPLQLRHPDRSRHPEPMVVAKPDAAKSHAIRVTAQVCGDCVSFRRGRFVCDGHPSLPVVICLFGENAKTPTSPKAPRDRAQIREARLWQGILGHFSPRPLSHRPGSPRSGTDDRTRGRAGSRGSG